MHLFHCIVANGEQTRGVLKAGVGGIAGYVAYSTTVSGNAVKNITITVDQVTNSYGAKDENANAIWGRNSVSGSGAGVIASGNTDENVQITSVTA